MERKDKIKKYLLNTKEPYILKIGNMRVQMTYSDTDKSFNECMVNILKQKGWHSK